VGEEINHCINIIPRIYSQLLYELIVRLTRFLDNGEVQLFTLQPEYEMETTYSQHLNY
jgi:hypothetical protein